MWRSLFMALGIMVAVMGIECMVIDSATVYASAEANPSFLDPMAPPGTVTKTIRPTEGLPWILVTVGMIVILYSISLRRPAG
jgi:hypothetical protein